MKQKETKKRQKETERRRQKETKRRRQKETKGDKRKQKETQGRRQKETKGETIYLDRLRYFIEAAAAAVTVGGSEEVKIKPPEETASNPHYKPL